MCKYGSHHGHGYEGRSEHHRECKEHLTRIEEKLDVIIGLLLDLDEEYEDEDEEEEGDYEEYGCNKNCCK